MQILTLDPPITVGDRTFVRYLDGHTYEDAEGATLYSGANTPSEADASDCIATPRTPPTRTATAAEIKAEAQRRILAIAPAWKQSNLIARILELTRQYGPPVEDWPAEAQAENAAAQAIWDKVKAIREHSDILEALPPSFDNLQSAGWPY